MSRGVKFEGSPKHTFAQGITTSMCYDGESDGGRQVMRMRNEFPIRQNIQRKRTEVRKIAKECKQLQGMIKIKV